jgi:hypothetical protein
VKPLVIAEEAEHELVGSVAFYENRESGLGLDFERAAQRVLKKIATSPDRWPVGKYGTRHYLMQRFPFAIFCKNCGSGGREENPTEGSEDNEEVANPIPTFVSFAVFCKNSL